MSSYDTAMQAASDAYEARRRADPNREEDDAKCWFAAEANRLTTRLRMCFESSPAIGLRYADGASFSASLSDLCLHADRASRGRTTWSEAKAKYLAIEAEEAA